jgi:hypothetical protein
MSNNPKSTTWKIITIVVIALIVVSSIIFMIPFLFNVNPPNDNTNPPEDHFLSGYLSDVSNKNDFSFQEKKIENINSTLTLENRSENLETGYDFLEALWNGTHYVLNNTCIFQYSYDDAYINSVEFYTDYFARSSSNMPPVDWFFWNFSSNEFQYNNTSIWGLHRVLGPDYFQNGEIKVNIFSYSNETFTIYRKFRCQFQYEVFCGPEIVKYVDLGDAVRIQYNNITWDSKNAFLSVKLFWSDSDDNTTWSQYNTITSFTGSGLRYIKINVSVELFNDSYLFDSISFNFENCSYYYYELNDIIFGLVNDTISNPDLKAFNFTFQSLITSVPVFESIICIYNYELVQWDDFGNFSTQQVQNLNVSHYFKDLLGFSINLKANSSQYFGLSYSIHVSINYL